MKHIIVGIDGSPSGKAAVKWCARLARATDAQVTAVHALTSVQEWSPAGSPKLTKPDRTAIEQLEKEWTAPLREAGVAFRTDISHDNPAALLRRAADRLDADLVVLGRRSHPPWAPALLGSVAHKVLHDAHCPVVIVPEVPGGEVAHRSAVVGVNGSTPSLAALRFGLEFARPLGLEVHALYAAPLSRLERGPLDMVYDEIDGPLVGASSALAALITDETTGCPISVSHEAVIGEAENVLTEASAGAELLIVGNVQRGLVGEMLHGSTSHYCAAHASCPVVLVPAA